MFLVYEAIHFDFAASDDCATKNPCKPNGYCQVVEDGYRCICEADYTGQFCQAGNYIFYSHRTQ